MNKPAKYLVAAVMVALVATTLLSAQSYAEFQANWDPKSDSAEEGMLWMREEEKLARDVYLALYQTWGIRTFANIAKAEQRHMDLVAVLLQSKGIADPVATLKPGEFSNPELAKLHADLVERGKASVVEALRVGALVEDLDIADLDKLLAQTDDKDTVLVYTNLVRGSEQHLRAFTSQLSAYRQSYEPQHISQERYTAILKTR